MTKEILLDDRGARHRRRLLRRRRSPAGADRRPGDRLRRRRRIGAPAAELEAQAVSRRPRQPLRLGGPQPARRTPTPAPSACSTTTPTTTSGRARPSPSAITTTAIPGWPAARMLANEFIRLPYPVLGAGAALGAALGQGAQGVRPQRTIKRTIVVHGPGAGDAGLRRARAGGPEGEGPLGHSGGAALRRPASAHHRDRAASSPDKAEAWLKEAGAVADLAASRRAGRSAADSIRPAPAAWATIRRRRW